MKNIVPKIKAMFSSDKPTTVNEAAVGVAAPQLSEKEIERRIDLAAKITVKRYGHIIERLAKE